MIILQQPKITEKTMKLAEQNLYTFLVGKKANKEQIAKLVADKFKVSVLSVKTINIKGARKMQRGTRKFYTLPDIKKAIVEIKKGQKIALFETPKEEATVSSAESEPVVMKEKRNILKNTKIRVEKSATGAAPTTQRKVITGK